MIKTGEFFFDPMDRIYKDHFPGNPVVPGSVIINAFSMAINKHFGGNPDMSLSQVNKFRFKKFTPPGLYDYSLSKEKSSVKCTLFNEGKAVATGVISL